HPDSILMIDSPPDIAFWGSGSGQFFPRFRFEERATDGDLLAALDEDQAPFRQIDNVTDQTLADYQKSFGRAVTKDEVFFYIYGILHSSEYRDRFGRDLKKVLPRVPKVKDFRSFSDAGRKLS